MTDSLEFTDFSDLPEVPDVAQWAEDLDQPYDDVPDFDGNANPEIDTVIRLDGDRRYVRTPTRRLFVDYRAQPDAYRHLNPLPGPGEQLFCIISGKYAMFDLIPALIESDGTIECTYISTLGFNKQNAADLLSLLDDGHIKQVNLLISYYFKSTSPEIYAMLIPQLRERGQRVLAMRTHCKIILAQMTNGTKYTIHGSPNLRSSQNIEQVSIDNHGGLHDSNAKWMLEDLLTKKDLGKDVIETNIKAV